MVSKPDRDRLQNERHQLYLASILKDDDNKYCADCDAKGPRWASWNIGVFLCIRCAGIHRNLGVHISKVKSVNLDTWSLEHLGMLYEVGNSRGRAIYEANLPDNFRRPQTDSALEQFIRSKYEHKRYIAREWVAPKPNLEALKQVIANMLGSAGTAANGPGHAPISGISKASSVLQSGGGLHTSSSMPQLPQPPSSSAHENGIARPRVSPAGAATHTSPSPASVLTKQPPSQPSQPVKEVNLLDLDMDAPAPASTQAITSKSSGLEELLLDTGSSSGFGDFVSSSTNSAWPGPGETQSQPSVTNTDVGKTAQSSTKTKEDILSLYGTRSNNVTAPMGNSIFGGPAPGALVDPSSQFLMGNSAQQGHGFFYAQPAVNPGGFPPMPAFNSGYPQQQPPQQQQQQQSYWSSQQPPNMTPNHLIGSGVGAAPNTGFGMQHNPFFANNTAAKAAPGFPGGFYPSQAPQSMFPTGNYQQPQSAQQQMASQQAYLEQIQQKLSSMQMGTTSSSASSFPQ